MLKSMTGFGRGEMKEGLKQVSVEIKTVNHRYIDISIRMPREIQVLEEKIREFIQKGIIRGKIDVFVSYSDLNTSTQIVLNEMLAGSYLEALSATAEKYGLPNSIGISDIAKFPDVISMNKQQVDEQNIWLFMLPALSAAMEKLLNMRAKEGEMLCNNLQQALNNIEAYFSYIVERAPAVPVEYKNRLEEKLKEIELQNAEPQRIALEIALFADKCSIDEEITRLRSHIVQFRNALNLPEAVGRKLDFLVQEMNREVNTIGSKANDLEITNNVILMKCELEKIREQIQNLE